jgi:hypothetical protein
LQESYRPDAAEGNPVIIGQTFEENGLLPIRTSCYA